ncbi:MAG: lytic transglycosylase domain-containing protein [Bryobacterales bacterium]|nr:lytic transglycosylase domain-containing protein [Bryobacterales bacterium]
MKTGACRLVSLLRRGSFVRVRVAVPVLLILAAAAPVWAGGHGDAVTSTVSVDRRSGRLIRRIVVPERIIQARIVPSTEAGETATGLHVKLPVHAAPVNDLVAEISPQHGVDPLLVHAVIHCESAYNQYAVSAKGAEGLMQLIPDTARRMGVQNSFDSRQNIEGGVKYLRFLQDRYPGDLRLVLAAYNAGEGAVDRYQGIPPYAETQEYVYRVGKRLGDLRRLAQRQRLPAAAAAPVKVAKVVEPEYRPLDSYVDASGQLHMRTR